MLLDCVSVGGGAEGSGGFMKEVIVDVGVRHVARTYKSEWVNFPPSPRRSAGMPLNEQIVQQEKQRSHWLTLFSFRSPPRLSRHVTLSITLLLVIVDECHFQGAGTADGLHLIEQLVGEKKAICAAERRGLRTLRVTEA
ncbi:uncharacterized [Tachysurus ichikawai]